MSRNTNSVMDNIAGRMSALEALMAAISELQQAMEREAIERPVKPENKPETNTSNFGKPAFGGPISSNYATKAQKQMALQNAKLKLDEAKRILQGVIEG